MEKTDVQRLFRQHYVRMLRVARAILGDEQESKDVISDIFANLLHGQTVLLADTEERYLLTSVRNQCLKRLRHLDVRQRMVDTTAAEPMTDESGGDERLIEIDEFVASRLSQYEQRIFYLRFTQGLTYEDVAQAEGISRVAVWKHLSHALNLIRNHFKK